MKSEVVCVRRDFIHVVDPEIYAVLATMDSEGKAAPITIVSVRSAVSFNISSGTAIRRIELLVKQGLVDEERIYQKRYVKINEKGKKVLEHLRAIRQILEE